MKKYDINDMIIMQQDKSMTWIMCGVLTKPEPEKKGKQHFGFSMIESLILFYEMNNVIMD